MSPRDSVIQTSLYSPYTPDSTDVNFSLQIPWPIRPQSAIAIYDGLLFDKNRLDTTDRNIRLPLVPLSVGYYFTFVHLFDPPYARSLPLSICVTARPLLPISQTIYMDLVADRSGFSEADVNLVNPTRQTYTIVSVSVGHPSFHVEQQNQRCVCSSESHCVVAKVVLNGARAGDFKTTVLVVYVGADKSGEERIEIPVHGCVEYGSFEPSEKEINLLPGVNSSHSIYFTNHFAVPVVVLGARIDSTFSRIVRFTPFLVQPGERSVNLTIQYTYKGTESIFETILFVDTNATNHQIEIVFYPGKLLISQTESLVNGDEIELALRQAAFHSSRHLTFFLRNPNPVPFSVTQMDVTSGLAVDFGWNKNHTIMPFAIDCLNLSITFLPVQAQGSRCDIITIGNPLSTVRVHISWLIRAGALAVSTDFPPVLYPGTFYNGTVYLNSSYSMGIHIKRMSTAVDFLTMNQVATVVGRNANIAVASVSLLLTPADFYNTSFGSELTDYKNTSNQIRLWNEHCRDPVILPVHFNLHAKSGAIFRVSFDLTIAQAHFNDIHLPVGYISRNTKLVRSVTIANPHDCWLSFYTDGVETVAVPHGFATLRVTLTVDTVGSFITERTITTNLTAPFSMFLHGECVRPQLEFRAIDTPRLNSVSFGDGRFARKAILTNVGKAPVSFGPFTVLGKLEDLAFNSDCNGSLSVKGACVLSLSVSRRKLTTPNAKGRITVDAGGTLCELDLVIQLNDSEIALLRVNRAVRYAIVIAVLYSTSLGPIGLFLLKRIRDWKKNRWRGVPKATAEHRSQGTQMMLTEVRVGGAWALSQAQCQISIQALEEMEVLIAMIE
jgi:hypothetical protein